MHPRPTPNPGILSIAPYVAGKSAAKGTPAIKLSSNENPLGPSPKAIAAYQEASGALHRYPDSQASALREAIARAHGLEASRIVCGAGSDELIGLLIHAYAAPGDEVLYSQHGFLMYKIYAQASGAVPISAPERELRADVDALLACVTPRTKLVFLANPNNPTGSYLSVSEVRRLRSGLRPDILLVLDAAYAEYALAEDYEDGAAMVRDSENVVMLRTFSKIYGLPALRLGWGYMPEAVADVLNRIRGPFNVSSPAIAAGIAAVEDRQWLEHARSHNTRERARMKDALAALGLYVAPSEGNFLLVEFDACTAHTSQAANAYLLERGIIVREVAGYGLPDFLRITIGTEAENDQVLAALKAFLAS